jgi:hypothetical protein
VIIALWLINGLLAHAKTRASIPKIVLSREAVLKLGQKGVAELSTGSMRLVGIVELLAAIGLILPLLLGILPILTPLAAAGLILVMLGAVVVHVRRKESPIPNIVLALIAAVSAVLGFIVVLG